MAARSNDCLAMADHLVKLFNNGFILCGWDFGGEEKKYGWLVIRFYYVLGKLSEVEF
ncbi:hypothetical protein Hanom_Chr12g01107021 [Helianthus anomalus]